jgi:predicted GNAT superfamily acetyltransferase
MLPQEWQTDHADMGGRMKRHAEEVGAMTSDARQLADETDARAGVVTREARVDELREVPNIWGAERGSYSWFLRELAFAGNPVIVAVSDLWPRTGVTGADRRNGLVGTAVGCLGWAGGAHVFSYLTVVASEDRTWDVELALRLRQRAVCLANGLQEIRWTYDPLSRRDARMSLVRLGGEVVRYLPASFSDRAEAVTGAELADRFEVRWRLDSPRVLRALAGERAPQWRAEGLLELVDDFETVRVASPGFAVELRRASRLAFDSLTDGRLRAELDTNEDYVFTADPSDRASYNASESEKD